MAREAKWVQKLVPQFDPHCVDCGDDTEWDWLWCGSCWKANVPRWAAMIRLPVCEYEPCTNEVAYSERSGTHRFCSNGCSGKHRSAIGQKGNWYS